MTAIGKWGAFLQPFLKWSLIAVGKCAETQRTEETGGGEKPVSNKVPGAESSSGGQRREHRNTGAEGSQNDFHAPEQAEVCC